MSRLIPAWLFASMLLVLSGCGGGGDTDAGAVADGGGDTSSSSAENAALSGAPGEMSGGSEMGAGMENGDGMYGAGGAGGEDMAEMYAEGGAGGEDMAEMYAEGGPGGEDMAEMYAEGGPGGEDMEEMYAEGGPGGEADMAEMEEMYAEGGPGGEADMAEMEEMYAEGGPGGEGGLAGEGGPGGEGMEEMYGEGGPGGGGVAENLPEGFEGKAVLAFRQGKDNDAMQYLYAHALTTEAGAENILPTIGWVAGLRQPKLAVRWGVGFVVTAPRNFNGDPKPVGSKQNIATKAGNRLGGDEGGYVGGGGEGEYGAGGGGGGGGNNSLLAKGAGDLGEKLMAGFTERVMNGEFGDVLKKANEGATGGRPRNGGGGMYDMEGGEGGYGGPGGGGGPSGGAESLTTVSQIKPGLSMLGIGTQKELIERARGENIDAVIVIDVTLRVNTKNGLVTNESTLALVDPKTQKKLHTTRKFNNITIQTARDAGKEDGIDKEFDKLFEVIDKGFKVVELPAALNSEIAAKRVNAIAAEKHENPLPILAEIKMYQHKGLLDEPAAFAAYEKILGVDFGRMFSTGEEEDKKKVLGSWLPEEA